MSSTYSPLKFELITTGEQSGTWGTTTNVNIGTAIGEAITGSADVTFASANVTLTLTDTNGTQTARNLRLRLTGTTGGARDLIVPNIEKQYIVQNDTANTVTIKNSTGTGVAIPSSVSAIVFNDGVNITSAGTYSTSLVTPLLAATDAAFVNPLPVTSGGTGVTTSTGTGSVVRATSPTLVTPALGTPTAAVLTNATGLPLTTGVTDTLPVLNGGTGVTTSTGSGANALATSPTLVTPILGTPTSGTLTNCTGLPMTTGVTGTLAVANGGTGVTTSTGSGANALATSPTLVTPILGTPTSGTLTSCTGLPLTTGVTGTLPVANGGTGVTTSTGSGANALATSPTLVTPILGTPTSGTLTNCTGLPMTTGVTGALPIANGGTNNSSLGVTDGGIVYADGTRLQTTAAGTSGQVLTSAGAGIPTWTTITSGGMTLLGTISTASGTSVSLTGLTLTTYKQLLCVLNNTIINATTSASMTLNGVNLLKSGGGTFIGQISINLTSGGFVSDTNKIAGSIPDVVTNVYPSGLTTASTSITFGTSGTTPSFGGGSILVYGIN